MRSERETGEAPQLERILGHTRNPDEVGYEPWPRDWAGGGAVDDEQALRELREGLARSRISGGARWEVPVRAAIAAAVLAFVVVVVVAGLLLRGGGDQGVPIGPLVSTSGSSGGSGVAPSAVGASGSVPGDPGGSVGSVGSVASPPGAEAAGAGTFRVHVVGQVRRPGVVSLGSDARVQDAIDAAGGARPRADLARINLARKVVDGERILVPKPGQKLPAEPEAGGGAPPGSEAGTGSGTGASAGPGSPIDLNTATVTELDELPGVGPVLAGRIVEWRQANGRFTTVDDLNEVSGIGDVTMEKLRPLVRV